jgi:hypothetical protein
MSRQNHKIMTVAARVSQIAAMNPHRSTQRKARRFLLGTSDAGAIDVSLPTGSGG